ncbi:MAG: DUF58 domain-containing protein [Galactobacter sp.]
MRIPVPTLRAWGLVCLGLVLVVIARILGRPEIAGIGAVLTVVPVAAWLAAFAWRSHPTTFGELPEQRLSTDSAGVAGLVPGVPVTVTLDAPADERDLRPAVRRTPGRRASGRRKVGHRPSGTGTYTWTPPTRGTYRLPSWIATRFDPLHLARVRARLDPATVLVVGPIPISAKVPGLEDAGLQSSRHGGDQLDTTTRPYQVGDPVRRVHWPVTARHGKVMVRPVLHESDGGLLVLLDRTPAHYTGAATEVASATGPAGVSRSDFDAAVSTAAAALRSLHSAARTGTSTGAARLAAFPPVTSPLPDDEALASVVPAPPHGEATLSAPTGTAAHTVLVTGMPGESAVDWPRTLHGTVSVLLHPAAADAHPSPKVTGAWKRAGWTWHLVQPETEPA